MPRQEVVVASGKRKTATARASIGPGKGRVRVNQRPIELYSPELARLKLMEPLYIAKEHMSSVDITVSVDGGGFMGQAQAARTAIARALIGYLHDDELEQKFRMYDRSLLVSDTRTHEPKHQLGRGARKKRQKSYR